jgi:hypothetical protein
MKATGKQIEKTTADIKKSLRREETEEQQADRAKQLKKFKDMMAGMKLLEKLGAEVIEGAAIVDLPELGGSHKLLSAGLPLFTLVNFEGH